MPSVEPLSPRPPLPAPPNVHTVTGRAHDGRTLQHQPCCQNTSRLVFLCSVLGTKSYSAASPRDECCGAVSYAPVPAGLRSSDYHEKLRRASYTSLQSFCTARHPLWRSYSAYVAPQFAYVANNRGPESTLIAPRRPVDVLTSVIRHCAKERMPLQWRKNAFVIGLFV